MHYMRREQAHAAATATAPAAHVVNMDLGSWMEDVDLPVMGQ